MSDTISHLAISESEQLDLLRKMHEIRFFEDACHRLFAQGLVRGSTHLGQGQGQEAVAVGACSVLSEGDTMTCTYRGHAAVLAMGAPLDRALGEILGKAEGLCGGKGGSPTSTASRWATTRSHKSLRTCSHRSRMERWPSASIPTAIRSGGF